MKHYDVNEWILFSRNQTEESTAENMEEHLLCCDDCMELYLSAIDGSDVQNADISSFFTENVMNEIEKYNKAKKEKPYWSKTMFYYAIAACLTLFFTLSGVFQYLFKSIPQAFNQLAKSPSSINSVVENGWSERLTNKTVIILDELKPKEN